VAGWGLTTWARRYPTRGRRCTSCAERPPTGKIPAIARLVRIPLEWSLSAVDGALLVRGDARPFALLGRWAGGRAIVGSEPVRAARAEEDPFALLEDRPALEERGDGVVGGGWFGYLSPRLARRLEPVGAGPAYRPAPLPDAALAFYDHVLRLDAGGRWWFEALWTARRAAALERRLAVLRARGAAGAPARRGFATAPWRLEPSPDGHALAVAACRERIVAGDLLQANLALRVASRLDGDPIDLFAAAAERLRPDRAAYLAGPWGAVASLSPELFLERRGRGVRSDPIKGTRPRAADRAAAAAQRDELAASEKDRAENVMIVDLVRNDLGRVCAPGSVRVPVLAEVRPHVGVWHLVSEVTGVLRDGVGDGALVRAAFPPGSVTGAPKIAALGVIAELESAGRELFTGAIGFAGPLAGLELSVAIRTFEIAGDAIGLPVGGGVTAGSDPTEEAAECAAKAAPLLRAIGARTAPATAAPPDASLAPRRLGPRPLPRPDPAAGVFETLRVRGGSPVALDAHLARLAASVRALYGRALPDGLAAEIRGAAAGAGDARLRVDAVPSRGRLAPVIAVTALPRRAPTATLRTVTLPGGLGAHKWADRRALDALAAAVAPAEPLLVDLDGAVLESERGHLLLVEDGGVLVTPPCDGRILPGVTRARALRAARRSGLTVRVERVGRARLAAAREVWLCGALRGLQPVTACDGGRLPEGDGRAGVALLLGPDGADEHEERDGDRQAEDRAEL
jgi:anthranilate/para-aminobenzoate synthase component I/branched-subunit amino acid aminotransferase/4-amino-4-deoxychorismate lyase